MGLYCSKQLETTFNQVGKKSLHIIFKAKAKDSFVEIVLHGVPTSLF